MSLADERGEDLGMVFRETQALAQACCCTREFGASPDNCGTPAPSPASAAPPAPLPGRILRGFPCHRLLHAAVGLSFLKQHNHVMRLL